MTVTVWGSCADVEGHTWWTDDVATEHGGALVAERRHRFAALPMASFAAVQPARIAVDIGHDGRDVGEVIHVERGDRTLTAVAVLDHLEAGDLDAFGECRWSTTTAHDRTSSTVELRSLGIVHVEDAASIGLAPLRWVPGDVRRGALDRLPLGRRPAVLERAVDHDRRRGRGDPLRIHELRGPLVHLDNGTVVRDGRYLDGGRIEARTSEAGDPPVTAVADRDAGLFLCATPPGRAPLARLVFGADPVGRTDPDLDTGRADRTVFRMLRTAPAAAALELVADGALETCLVRRNLGRTGWAVAELRP